MGLNRVPKAQKDEFVGLCISDALVFSWYGVKACATESVRKARKRSKFGHFQGLALRSKMGGSKTGFRRLRKRCCRMGLVDTE